MIYAIITAAVSEAQPKHKEQSNEPKETTPFVLQEKAGKSDDCVVSNSTRRHPDFNVENTRYHFAV